VVGGDAESAVIGKQQIAEFSFAQPRGVLQHGLEHRLEIAGRARDHLQHV
jgi:hypothetical protein